MTENSKLIMKVCDNFHKPCVAYDMGIRIVIIAVHSVHRLYKTAVN